MEGVERKTETIIRKSSGIRVFLLDPERFLRVFYYL